MGAKDITFHRKKDMAYCDVSALEGTNVDKLVQQVGLSSLLPQQK